MRSFTNRNPNPFPPIVSVVTSLRVFSMPTSTVFPVQITSIQIVPSKEVERSIPQYCSNLH